MRNSCKRDRCIIYTVFCCCFFAQAVKLEGSHDRYLALVSCLGKQDTEESVILGMDLKENTAAIGLIMPVWAHTHIQLDGDGCVHFNFES